MEDGVWARKSEGVGNQLVQLVFLIHQRDRQRDRQTDGRTDDTQSQDRAMHYSASRGNDNDNLWHGSFRSQSYFDSGNGQRRSQERNNPLVIRHLNQL